jgi:hypothetical protein
MGNRYDTSIGGSTGCFPPPFGAWGFPWGKKGRPHIRKSDENIFIYDRTKYIETV